MQENLLKNLDISVIMDKQRLIIPFIGLFIAFIFSTNLYKAQQLKIESVKKQIVEEEKIDQLLKLLKIQDRKFSEYKNMFGAKDFSLIMQKISEFAASSDTKIISFNPLTKFNTGILTNLPLRVKVEGSYHKIGNFLSRIESSADILKIVSFRLSKTSSSSAGSDEALSADIQINAVYISE
ncbi:MAG: type 4a pilus biogenesis protein PilO [Candidatus Omnitrophota bacterium]